MVGQANGVETSDLVDTRKRLLSFRKEDWPCSCLPVLGHRAGLTKAGEYFSLIGATSHTGGIPFKWA